MFRFELGQIVENNTFGIGKVIQRTEYLGLSPNKYRVQFIDKVGHPLREWISEEYLIISH